MSDDNVVPFPKQYNLPSTPDPRRAEKAEKAREHAIRREERARERKRLSDRLMACRKADSIVRVTVAKRLGELYAAVKRVGIRGVLGEVFREAGLQNETTDSSKRRVRYVVLPGETPNSKLLSSNLQKYERLADALAKALGRESDEVFMEVFQGIFPDEFPVREFADQEIYDHVSFMLNTICTGISRKHNLQAAFKLATRWAIGIGADNQWEPTVPVLQFGSDNMPLDYWIHDADCGYVANMIPSVKLSGRCNYSISVIATLHGLCVSNQDSRAPESIVDWTAIARAYGTAPAEIHVKHNVYLVVLPGSSSAPIAALLERYDIDPLIGDARPYSFQSNDSNWYTFRSVLPNGTEEINAFQIDDSRLASVDQPKVRQALKKFLDHEGRFRIRKLTPSTLMDSYDHFDCELVDFGFGSGPGYDSIALWHGTDGTFENPRSIPEDLPSFAPSRSMAAVIERNIAHAPINARLDGLLEQQILQFKTSLDAYISTRRKSFAEATKSILEHWLAENQASNPAPQVE